MSSTTRETARSVAKLIFIIQTLAIFGWLILALQVLNATGSFGFDKIMDVFEIVGEMGDGGFDASGSGFTEGTSMDLTSMVMVYQGFAKVAVIVLQYFFWLAFGWPRSKS